MKFDFNIKRRKKIIAIILSIVILTSGTMAFFISKDTIANYFKVGDLTIDVEEPNYKEPDNWQGEKVIKDANIKNTNTMPELIRVAIEPRFEDDNGEFYSGNVNLLEFEFVNVTEDKSAKDKWIDGGDGYYYYTSVLKEGENTSNIINSVKFNVLDKDRELYNEKTLKAVVRAEAVFSGSNGWKTEWNVENRKISEMLEKLSSN